MTVYTVAGSKGGVGKTTLAVHLAAQLLRHHGAVRLVDADPQAHATAWCRRALPGVEVVQAVGRDELLQAVQGASTVVVDVLGAASDVHLVAIFAADVVVLPAAPGLLDLSALKSTADLVAQARQLRHGTAPRAVAVLNRFDARTNVAREAAEHLQRLGLHLAGTIRTSVAVADAPGQGRLVEGAAGADLEAVAENIITGSHHVEAN